MKIAICDDIKEHCSIVKRIWQDCVDQNFLYEIFEFDCAEDLLKTYKNQERYDLLVLDVEMGEISGMEAAKQIRRFDKAVKIIFITAYDQYIREAFDVAAIHYLEKPIEETKLKLLFRAIIKEYREIHYEMFFKILNARNMEETIKLYAAEIMYFESYNRQVVIHTVSGEVYKTKQKISALEKELRGRNFVRVHMSFLVNVKYIRKINRESVVLKQNGIEHNIPLSRKQRELVEETFLDYRVGDYRL